MTKRRTLKCLVLIGALACGGCFGAPFSPVPPSGMSGPSASGASPGDGGVTLAGEEDSSPSSGDGGSAPAEKPYRDPTAGADTPVTVSGNTSGFTPKNPPCRGIREVRLCIGQVRIAAEGPADEAGRLPYRVTGWVYAKINGGEWKAINSPWLLDVFDLLHPEAPAGKTRVDETGFDFLMNATVGRPIRLQEKFCGRIARLDLTTPEAYPPAAVLDPCADPEYTDETDPDWKPEEEFPELPIGTLPVAVPPRGVTPPSTPLTPPDVEPPAEEFELKKYRRIDDGDRPYRPLGPAYRN
ncbi:MAG TPA: hypothetical protein VFX30_15030 [bacterium]|nr:hypothetical protein [bacterium]